MMFQVETFAKVEPELRGLIGRHFEEIREPDSPELDPNWPFFHALEKSGNLFVVTARAAGALAGYIIFVVAPLPHYRTRLAAHDDAHFIAPEHRKGPAALRLFRFAEEALKARGVSRISFHHKNRPDIDKGKVFERLGYRPVETVWSKSLEA